MNNVSDAVALIQARQNYANVVYNKPGVFNIISGVILILIGLPVLIFHPIIGTVVIYIGWCLIKSVRYGKNRVAWAKLTLDAAEKAAAER